MSWAALRDSWQTRADPDAEAAAAMPPARVSMLRRKIFRRDLLESLVALLIAPLFLAFAVMAWLHGKWWVFGFSAFLVAAVVYVPWRLWRERRKLPKSDPSRPVREYLLAEREAMRVQAELLEGIWWWYLGPLAIGVVGLYVSMRGFVWQSAAYAAVVLVFYFAIGKANQVAARSQYRVAMEEIDEQVSQLAIGQSSEEPNDDQPKDS